MSRITSQPKRRDRWVVEVTERSTRTLGWGGQGLFPLDHPLTWVLGRDEAGLFVRPLGDTGDQRSMERLNPKMGGPFVECTLTRKGRPDLKIRVKAAPSISAAFDLADTEKTEEVCVFTCVQDWAIASARLSSDRVHVAGLGTPGLELRREGGQYVVKALQDEVGVSGVALALNEERKLSASDLVQSVFASGAVQWRFAYATAPAIPESLSRPTSWRELLMGDASVDGAAFRKSAAGALGTVLLLALIAVFFPQSKPEEEELIPPQFAKIVMSPGRPAEAPAAAPTSGGAAQSAPKKAAETAVAQAFRTKALSGAVSSLLKGGMSKMLASSALTVSGSAQAQRMLASRSSSLATSDTQAAVQAPSQRAVAGVGGQGDGTGAGYGSGTKAGVTGQGGGQISLALDESVVEEGLTKEEVGEVIHKHMSEIRYCYESSLMRTPDIEGKLTSSFVIGGDGFVKTSQVKSSTLPDPRLDDCILRRLKTWKFPKPKGGIDVPVTYPFVFKTLGR